MRNRSWCLVALALGLATTSLHAQVPVHKHYQHTDSFDTASPSGARAPRLQKVGKHAFPVTTTGAARWRKPAVARHGEGIFSRGNGRNAA